MHARSALALLFLSCGVASAGLDDGREAAKPGEPPPAPPPPPPSMSDPAPPSGPQPGGPIGALPLFLRDGRTYDQQRDYVEWSGPVSLVTLTHRDQTALPAAEGGDACSDGCTEEVTRLQPGASVSGRFTFLETFNVQVAREPGAGDVKVEACGQTVTEAALGAPGAGIAGFNNYPAPAWQVPTEGDCTWRVTALRAFVDFRAVTAKLRTSAAPPAVDVKVNGSDDEVTLTSPGHFTVSWTSSGGACEASGSWSGAPARSGSQDYSGAKSGRYVYALTCRSSAGVASDSVEVEVFTPQ